MPALRIAIVTSTFPPYRGGMGRVAETDARQLATLGHDVTVLTPQRGAASPSATAGLPYRVQHLPVWLRLPNVSNGVFVPTAALALGRYDLVVLHYPFYGAAEPLWMAKMLGRRGKLLITYHMDALGAGWLKPFMAAHSRYVMPRIITSADLVAVTTEDYASHGNLKHVMGTHPMLFRELRLAVDVERFSPGQRDADFMARYGLEMDDRLVLFLGGLDRPHYFKGLANLLLAMTTPGLAKAKMLIIGSGELRPDYEDQAEKLGLRGRVVFAGNVSDEELPDHLRLGSVLAFPSVDKSEAFGIAALEAMACGVPVVSSNLAGVRTIVREGETGRRVPAGSASALGLALADVLADEPRRRAMGEAARQMAVREYSEAARLEAWRGLLEEVHPDWKRFN
jgi:glycosyltransferase involved in cell wall biosynthesis